MSGSGPSHRVAKTAAVCALLGLSTSVIVAWTLSTWPVLLRRNVTAVRLADWQSHTCQHIRSVGVDTAFIVWQPGMRLNDPALEFGWDERYDAMPRWSEFPPADPTTALTETGESRLVCRAGWPLRCVNGASGGPTTLPDRRWFRGMIRVPHPTRAGELQLPIAPMWLGMIVNSIVFALAWYVLLPPFGPRALRSWRRGRRGLCPGCGYDLQRVEGPRCPECGREGAEG